MADPHTLPWGSHPSPGPRARRRGLELLFILGFVVCLLLGAAALALLWNLTRPAPLPASSDSAALFDRDAVVVGLATRALAGDDSTALIGQALRAGELDTAAALLLFDTSVTPAARVALWQQLARLWLDAGDTARATLAYDRVLQLAVLDPAQHSLGRSQLLVQAASGFDALSLPEAAVDAAWQAVRSIRQSPNLLPAQRAELMQDLRPVVAGAESRIDDVRLIGQVEELLRNPYGATPGALVPSTWSLLQTPLSPDEPTIAALNAAVEASRLAARALADRDVLTSGVDVEPERQALAAALAAEDALRAQTAQSLLASASTLQQQIAVLLDDQTRLIAKLQVAHGAFGLLLLPEWEAARPAIEAELAAVTANIDRLVAALAESQATPLEQNLLRAEAAHWLALQHVLGFWPGGAAEQVNEQLRFAQDELVRLGSPLALPVAWEPDAPLPGFRIQQR